MNRARLALVAITIISGSSALLACPVCFQVEANSTTTGVHAAVLILMAVTIGVLSSIGVFIAGFVRRERRLSGGSA
jgi:hypothetical protein